LLFALALCSFLFPLSSFLFALCSLLFSSLKKNPSLRSVQRINSLKGQDLKAEMEEVQLALGFAAPAEWATHQYAEREAGREAEQKAERERQQNIYSNL
tara:strand:+ start:206 stop:502 length:297 start_codon:yes stop_codon:yes gene_type:complete